MVTTHLMTQGAQCGWSAGDYSKMQDPCNGLNHQAGEPDTQLGWPISRSQQRHHRNRAKRKPGPQPHRTTWCTMKKANKKWNLMVKKILTEPIQIIQLNVNHRPDVMTVMQQEYLWDTDILLYQEPAFSWSNLPQHSFLTPKIPGFRTILPIPIEQLRTPPVNCLPRVMAYAHKRDDMFIILRYNLCLDHDMMIIEIQQQPHQPILIANIYNLPAGSTGAHSTGQRLRNLDLPNTYPTIITGDFNLHHPDWEEMTTEPIAAAKTMAEWLQDTYFSLLNVHNYPTFHHHNHIHHSVCDLTMANERAIGWSLVSHWRVDEDAQTGSNHVVIWYTVANERVTTGETVRERLNWKKSKRKGIQQGL